ncbi:hypothetical protein [Roseivirga echinicomitans]|uniref:hypothetical protein n=1 Tax=Roseivirga echinicomitans TaxID=296218 RepID=UPI0012FDFB85|nr:hypothetical protein [Roseivirga echinicomitans]
MDNSRELSANSRRILPRLRNGQFSTEKYSLSTYAEAPAQVYRMTIKRTVTLSVLPLRQDRESLLNVPPS